MVTITDPEGFVSTFREGIEAVLIDKLGDEGATQALLAFAKQHIEEDEHDEVERIQSEDPKQFNLIMGNIIFSDIDHTMTWLQSQNFPEENN